MPELPEVETVKRTLAPLIIGRTITGVAVYQPVVVKKPGIEKFKEEVPGETFQNIRRRGKYLILHLTGQKVLVIHLRMTGQLVYQEQSQALKKHTHLIFHLDNGWEMRFVDQRRFGCVWMVSEDEIETISGLCALGPEPLLPDFDLAYLAQSLVGRKAKIKQVLLDQRIIAGIGNIYADEILFRSGIHPERTACSLTEREIDRLFDAIKTTLAEAVEKRGTTFSDYVDGRGEKGSFQHHLNVYQQVGKECPRCKTAIIRSKVGSRSAYYCPGCQK